MTDMDSIETQVRPKIQAEHSYEWQERTYRTLATGSVVVDKLLAAFTCEEEPKQGQLLAQIDV